MVLFRRRCGYAYGRGNVAQSKNGKSKNEDKVKRSVLRARIAQLEKQNRELLDLNARQLDRLIKQSLLQNRIQELEHALAQKA